MSAAAHPRPLGWLVRWGLHLSVAVGLLGLVVWRAKLWELNQQFGDFAVWPAVGAALLNVPALALMTFRGRFILGRLHHDVPFFSLLPISVLGNVAGSLTPASTGDLVRTPFFKERHDIPYADGLATVIYERGFALLILSLSTAAAAAWSALPAGAAAGVTTGAIVLMAATPTVAAFALQRMRHLLPTNEADGGSGSTLRRTLGAIGRSLESLLTLLRDPWATVSVTLTNLVIFSIIATQMWFVLRALDIDLSLAEAWTALGASMLAAIATFLPLGLGTMDATLAAVVGASGNSFSSGAAAALLLRATITLPLGLLALGSYLYLIGGRRGRVAPEVT